MKEENKNRIVRELVFDYRSEHMPLDKRNMAPLITTR